jgi:hypothetical protein
MLHFAAVIVLLLEQTNIGTKTSMHVTMDLLPQYMMRLNLKYFCFW